MTTNIVTAKFCNSRRTTTRPLTQYDYGQILRIEGIDLPDAYEVDFSNNQYTGDSKPQLGDASGVAIPEEYIKTGKDIYAFIYLHAGESDGETFYWIKIPNELRPARTEEAPTPEEQSIIDQTIAALNTGVQKVEDIADGLEEQIDTALQEAKDSGEFDGEDGFSPEITVEDITGGHRVTVVDKDGTETFDVMDGEEGDTGRGIVTIEKTSTSGLVDTYTITYSDNTTGAFYVTNGENGDPGTPGFSPVVVISSITGGHRVTITDADGTRSFDVMDGADGDNGRGIASVVLNSDYTLTFTYTDGTTYTTSSIRGAKGDDGYSPIASVNKVGNVATITITDEIGTTTATVNDGEDGAPGVSPTVTVTDITGGHRITITDATGAHSFDVMDGDVADAPVQSVNGQTGAVVLDAQDVGAYEKPVTGIPKTDLASDVQTSLGKADTALQSAPVTSVNTKTGAVVLTPSDIGAGTYSKPSGGIPASDLAAGVIPTVPVQDVQVNDVSILNDGVANIPVAAVGVYGAVKITSNVSNSGISMDEYGNIIINAATSGLLKQGTNTRMPVVASRQHESVFYGLAKAAGDSTQSSSSNAVGAYTDAAKVAIQKMLGIYEAPWELIREDEVTHATSELLDITVDGNGQAFELTDIRMLIQVPTQETDFIIENYASVYAYYGSADRIGFVGIGNSTYTIAANSSNYMMMLDIEWQKGMSKMEGMMLQKETGRTSLQTGLYFSTTSSNREFIVGNAAFSKIRISAFSGKLKFRLYGRRKWN